MPSLLSVSLHLGGQNGNWSIPPGRSRRVYTYGLHLRVSVSRPAITQTLYKEFVANVEALANGVTPRPRFLRYKPPHATDYYFSWHGPAYTQMSAAMYELDEKLETYLSSTMVAVKAKARHWYVPNACEHPIVSEMRAACADVGVTYGEVQCLETP